MTNSFISNNYAYIKVIDQVKEKLLTQSLGLIDDLIDLIINEYKEIITKGLIKLSEVYEDDFAPDEIKQGLLYKQIFTHISDLLQYRDNDFITLPYLMKHFDDKELGQLVINADNGKWHLELYPSSEYKMESITLASFEEHEINEVIDAFINQWINIFNSKVMFTFRDNPNTPVRDFFNQWADMNKVVNPELTNEPTKTEVSLEPFEINIEFSGTKES